MRFLWILITEFLVIIALFKAEEAKRLEKERKAAQKAKEAAEKEAQKRIPPTELFRRETDKYSQFDDRVRGIVHLGKQEMFTT